ncbi:MAG: alkaline phosphatase D, partial [Myxococcota bacterium]
MTTKKSRTKTRKSESDLAGSGIQFGRRTFIKGAVAVPLVAACGSDTESASTSDGGATPDAQAGHDVTAADTALDSSVPAYDPSDVVEDTTAFPLPVQSGAMTQNSAIVWGFSATEAPVHLRVWPNGSPEPGAAEEMTPVDGYLKVNADALQAATHYNFAFFIGPQDAPTGRSVIGSFRTTAAAGDLPTVTLAATTCTKDWNAPYQALSVISKTPVDALCHLGDMSYNDMASTREEYRAAWQETLRDPGYRDVLPSTGMYMTWDDHEIANNDWSTLPAAHREAGIEAFFETLPVPRGEGNRLWGSYRLGDTVEVFVLDCRSERVAEPAEPGGKRLYMSVAQMDWLKGALTDSPCRYKAIMSSVPITAMESDWPTADTWNGYPNQRNELLDHITSGISGVIFLAGDYHFGGVSRVEADGPRASINEVLVGPGASSPNPLIGSVEIAPALAETFVPAKQWDHYATRHAATFLTFDPAKDEVAVR